MEPAVLVVGNCNSDTGTFEGFKARFMGEKVGEFEAGDRWRLTLYKCGWNKYQGYRVYEADERVPKSPRYELRPQEGEKVNPRDPYRSYHKLYRPEEVAEEWPMFAKDVDGLRITDIDAKDSDPAWNERGTL